MKIVRFAAILMAFVYNVKKITIYKMDNVKKIALKSINNLKVCAYKEDVIPN